jgi:septal ring factor EnvC (AmiA/AmiB activator)
VLRIALIGMVVALSMIASARASGQTPPTLEALDARIAAANSELQRATVERGRVDVEIEALVAERAAAERRLRERVVALYRMRRAGLLPLADGFDALLRHHARAERVERMVRRDVVALRALDRRVAALREESTRLADEVQRAEEAASALRAERQALERAMLGLWAGIGPAGNPVAEYRDDVFGLRISGGSAIGPRFDELRGNLPLPVVGSAQLRDAEREGGPGVEIVAPGGASVRAVSGGRVAYAARHPAYGALVIIDHGDAYYTVYGGLGAIGVVVGAHVEAEAVLGTVGASPLFFQVRRGTRPLPARAWLGF